MKHIICFLVVGSVFVTFSNRSYCDEPGAKPAKAIKKERSESALLKERADLKAEIERLSRYMRDMKSAGGKRTINPNVDDYSALMKQKSAAEQRLDKVEQLIEETTGFGADPK